MIGASSSPVQEWLEAVAPLVWSLFDGVRAVCVRIEGVELGTANAVVGELPVEPTHLPLLVNATTSGELTLGFESGCAHSLSRHRSRLTLAVVALENALHLRSRPDVATPLQRAATEHWLELAEGRSSLVRQGNDIVVVDTPPHSSTRRRLNAADVAVVRASIRGDGYKQIADALSCSTGSVSRILSHAAAKLGVLPVDLLHVAATLGVESPSIVREASLTEAERDVLSLLRQGHSNATIARLRARSERTVANQVSSLLRKTRTTSRRALAAARSVA